MKNPKINIPEFHLWKLIVFLGLIVFIVLYVLGRNSTAELRFENKILEKENATQLKKVDSLNKVNLILDSQLSDQDILIEKYTDKLKHYKSQTSKFKKQYEESINNYNVLNREQRLQSVRQLINE